MTALRKLAKDQQCIRCGNSFGVCLRHYNGFRAHRLGKGRGIKCHDMAGAEFCNECDADFSEANYHKWDGGSKSIERSEEFLFWCLMTNIRRAANEMP